ncbi:hypothetical protein [Streptomyces sp. NPDC020298]|uniref:hypothetical protein n=1 Tax=unclassified Streptomyces TaxID=2593676 RepID=UPI0033CC8B7F
MFIARTRYDQLRRQYDHQTALREEAEQIAARREGTIVRLQSQLAHRDDEHPDSPVPTPTPATGDARLKEQLNLSERARQSLDAQCLQLHWTNVNLEREILTLREQLAELQTAQEQGQEVAS